MAEPTVAIIPARGGSRRIPRKNVRPFHGRPLIARTIETLLAARRVGRVVVSTDDDEIAEIAEAAGADVPFRRPPHLADDHAATLPVVQHAISALEGVDGHRLGAVCVAYPAAVFVSPAEVDEAFDLLTDDVPFVFTVTDIGAPIERVLRRSHDGRTTMQWPEHERTRSQDLPAAYQDAGQLYWGHRDAWIAGHSVLTGGARSIVLPRWRVQDIDTPEDWTRAELLFEVLHRDA